MNKAFTLIELLVVISIIGLLSSVVISGLEESRENAKVSAVVASIRGLETAITSYTLDTKKYPKSCDGGCTPTNDPMINSNGIKGWKGPYSRSMWDLKHPWGGHMSYGDYDLDKDGKKDHYIILNDDAPQENSLGNSGIIPYSAMIKIDNLLDDGDLSTGKVRGNGAYSTAKGELVYVIKI